MIGMDKRVESLWPQLCSGDEVAVLNLYGSGGLRGALLFPMHFACRDGCLVIGSERIRSLDHSRNLADARRKQLWHGRYSTTLTSAITSMGTLQ